MAVRASPSDYFLALHRLILGAEVTDRSGRSMGITRGVDAVRSAARQAHAKGNTVIFIGNGGSAGIASHLAIDFSKNGGIRALALNDPSALTCLGNDFGYESIFAKQLSFHARPGDLLVAISSSGKSPSILNAVDAARERDCGVVTLSGFGEDNPLRCRGAVNFYVRSRAYGIVEVAHLALCHAILDLEMGWRPPRQESQGMKADADAAIG